MLIFGPYKLNHHLWHSFILFQGVWRRKTGYTDQNSSNTCAMPNNFIVIYLQADQCRRLEESRGGMSQLLSTFELLANYGVTHVPY